MKCDRYRQWFRHNRHPGKSFQPIHDSKNGIHFEALENSGKRHVFDILEFETNATIIGKYENLEPRTSREDETIKRLEENDDLHLEEILLMILEKAFMSTDGVKRFLKERIRDRDAGIELPEA